MSTAPEAAQRPQDEKPLRCAVRRRSPPAPKPLRQRSIETEARIESEDSSEIAATTSIPASTAGTASSTSKSHRSRRPLRPRSQATGTKHLLRRERINGLEEPHRRRSGNPGRPSNPKHGSDTWSTAKAHQVLNCTTTKPVGCPALAVDNASRVHEPHPGPLSRAHPHAGGLPVFD